MPAANPPRRLGAPMQFKPGSSLMDKVDQVFHAGMVRHLVVEKDGKRLADVPLLLVIAAAVVAIWLVVGLLVVALLMDYKISISNTDSDKEEASVDLDTLKG